jgi:hypothetical protein
MSHSIDERNEMAGYFVEAAKNYSPQEVDKAKFHIARAFKKFPDQSLRNYEEDFRRLGAALEIEWEELMFMVEAAIPKVKFPHGSGLEEVIGKAMLDEESFWEICRGKSRVLIVVISLLSELHSPDPFNIPVDVLAHRLRLSRQVVFDIITVLQNRGYIRCVKAHNYAAGKGRLFEWMSGYSCR